MKIHQGKLQAKGLRIAIVVSRFNSFISERLLEGALEALQKMGALEADLTVYKVPGSFEVPLLAKKIAKAIISKGHTWCELSWELEDNKAILRFAASLGAEVYKKYRIYETKIPNGGV